MKRKWSLILTLTLALALVSSSSALAHSDYKKNNVTVAQGVQMIVKGLKLNIDNLRFIKEPKASDYFSKVPDDAKYAQAFIIAQNNGLELPKDINPKAWMTREQFAHYLYKALLTKGDYAFIDIFAVIGDEAQINPAYMDSIQKLLIAKIVKLDKDQKFYPKKILNRPEASIMLSNTVEFVKTAKPIPPVVDPDQPVIDEKVTLATDKISADVNKVTIAWGTKPNAGYRITIDSINFNDEDGTAVVNYSFHYPKIGVMYIQGIAHPKAETFISSKYKIEIKSAK